MVKTENFDLQNVKNNCAAVSVHRSLLRYSMRALCICFLIPSLDGKSLCSLSINLRKKTSSWCMSVIAMLAMVLLLREFMALR